MGGMQGGRGRFGRGCTVGSVVLNVVLWGWGLGIQNVDLAAECG